MKQLNFTSQICTSREQSQRLLDMGIKRGTADMRYHFTNSPLEPLQWELQTKPPVLRGAFWTEERIARLARRGESGEEVFDRLWGKDVPAWSLARLMELMPSLITQRPGNILSCLEIGSWYVGYRQEEDCTLPDYICYIDNPNLFDACISVIEWLIQNDYFNKDYLQS